MSAAEVTISGVLYDRVNRTTQNVVLIGEASLTNIGIGGGPVIPPEGEKPPGIWPSPGRPEHPIAPGGRPPGIWGGSGGLPKPPGVWPGGHPEHPIAPGGPEIPPIPTDPPPDGADKPPPEGGGWGFVAEWSQWGYFPGPEEARPR